MCVFVMGTRVWLSLPVSRGRCFFVVFWPEEQQEASLLCVVCGAVCGRHTLLFLSYCVTDELVRQSRFWFRFTFRSFLSVLWLGRQARFLCLIFSLDFDF